MAISFVVVLVLAGISIGMILIGIVRFNYITDSDIKNDIQDVYEYEMTENLSINHWNCSINYVETDSEKVKIVVEHSKYIETKVNKYNEIVEVYCISNGAKTMEIIRDIIKDINNKEIVEYPNPVMNVYASKENIDKIKRNEIRKYELSIEKELDEAHQENEELETKIFKNK